MDRNKDEFYRELAQQAEALLSTTSDRVANAANLSALIFQSLPQVNWAGFYFRDGDTLIVGPFQGKPACVLIPMGEGVCGTAAATRTVQRVADVHAFDGHIACDADSRSEIVIPLLADGEVFAVLDIDSPVSGRFDAQDQHGLEQLAAIYTRSVAR